MSNTGSPEPTAERQRLGWGAIGLAAVLVLLAVMIGVQVLGVLYGVLFPPQPARLDSFVELTHTSPSYGVDDWLFASSDDACRIVRFFQSNGASCRVAPGTCDSGFAEGEEMRAGFNVARCTGSIEWSIFAQRYYVNIAAGYEEDAPSRVRLEREIFWTGSLPPAATD